MTTVILGGLMVCVAVFILMMVVIPSGEKGLLERRLAGVDEEYTVTVPNAPEELDSEMSLPIFERVIAPLLNKLGGSLAQRSKQGQMAEIQRMIDQSGEPQPPERIFALRVILPICFIALVILVDFDFHLSTIELVGGGGFLAFLGYALPTSSLKGKIKKRGKEISRGMPGVMDLLTISMEAGLSMDMAMVRVAESEPGVLGREFERTLDEIRLGRPRLEALQAMADRSPAEELHEFIRAIVQAEPLGVSIANVMRVQSEDLRRVRRQKAEETGHRAPVLMLLPMMLCIFPCIFLILLGPAALKLMSGGA